MCADVVTHKHVMECPIIDLHWEHSIRGTSCSNIDNAKKLAQKSIDALIGENDLFTIAEILTSL